MFKLTVDVFSGRENPAWAVDSEAGARALRDLAALPGTRDDLDDAPPNLGYRGVVVEALDESFEQRFGLPQAFRVASPGSDGRAFEIVERLLAELSAPDVQGWTNLVDPESAVDREFLLAQLEEAAGASPAAPMEFPPEPDLSDRLGPDEEGFDPLSGEAVRCGHEAFWFDASTWNAAAYVTRNNCYNFATARRTNTFAQPGKASGLPQRPIGCATQQRGALGDGAVKHPNCASAGSAPRHLTALVIWPGTDYHWYRKHANGMWGHKPGQTRARLHDNVGATIWNPYTCSRAPYTVFCGWFYCPRTMRVW